MNIDRCRECGEEDWGGSRDFFADHYQALCALFLRLSSFLFSSSLLRAERTSRRFRKYTKGKMKKKLALQTEEDEEKEKQKDERQRSEDRRRHEEEKTQGQQELEEVEEEEEEERRRRESAEIESEGKDGRNFKSSAKMDAEILVGGKSNQIPLVEA